MSFLQHVGSILRSILHIGEQTAIIAAPFVTTAFPELAPIYTSAIGLATAAEATIAKTGSGPQKLAQLTAELIPKIHEWATANGIQWDDAGIQKWASALVDTINMIPAPTKPAA